MRNDELIEPEIARQLSIPRLDVPEKWEGMITEAQLQDFPPEQRSILFAISRIERKVDFGINALVEANRHQRVLEARFIRQRNWKWALAKWVSATAVAAFVAAFGQKLARLIAP